MNKFDLRLKAMAKEESCPAPEGFDARMEDRVNQLTGNRSISRPARWALAVACLCAVLAVAAAATAHWGVFSDGFHPHPDPGTANALLHKTTLKGTAVFDMDDVLEEAAVLAEIRNEERRRLFELDPNSLSCGPANCAAFESWQAASDFIGVPLAENPVLDQYPHRETLVGSTVDKSWLHATGIWLVDGIEVWVRARLRTTHAEEESAYTVGYGFDPTEAKVKETPIQMSDGSSGLMFSCYREGEGTFYEGCFIREGVLYHIEFFCPEEKTTPAAEQLLTDIMAAY